PVPRLRRGPAVPVPLGGDRLSRRGGRGVAGAFRADRLRRGPGLHRVARRGVRLRLAQGGVPMAVAPDGNFFVSKLDALASFVRKYSLWPMPFATACCGIELM